MNLSAVTLFDSDVALKLYSDLSHGGISAAISTFINNTHASNDCNGRGICKISVGALLGATSVAADLAPNSLLYLHKDSLRQVGVNLVSSGFVEDTYPMTNAEQVGVVVYDTVLSSPVTQLQSWGLSESGASLAVAVTKIGVATFADQFIDKYGSNVSTSQKEGSHRHYQDDFKPIKKINDQMLSKAYCEAFIAAVGVVHDLNTLRAKKSDTK